MIRNYKEAVDFLYGNLPMFQRIGAAALKHDLSNTVKLCDALGNPQRKFPSIHIAGTNGKGSTAHMLAAVFQSSGYKTGLYTSPHLKSFTERIKIDGEEADPDYIVDFINRMREVIDNVKPSFFEMTVAMAFDYFYRNKVDMAVIETGLGGRLDSTNVIQPVVSVITNIGTDHAELLGDTPEKIAFEKAGIIKSNTPVVISEKQPDVAHIFESIARERNSPIIFADERYQVELTEEGFYASANDPAARISVDMPLKGKYQIKNLAGVLASIELLRRHYTLPEEKVVHGLENVIQLTGLKGRWQILQQHPLVVCDTGHNAEGIAYIAEQIRSIPYSNLFLVLGMAREKDVEKMLSFFPAAANYVFCQANIPRALDADELATRGKNVGIVGNVIRDVNDALQWALKQARPDDLIFVGGSTFVVAEIDGL